MQTALILVAIPLGLVAGGFSTMLADRMLDESRLTLRSRCPHCEAALSWTDTLPVISWFRLDRRCRHCDVPITVGYPLVEAVTMLLFVLVAVRYDQTDALIVVPWVLVTAGMALVATDLATYRLPNRIVFPTFWISLALMVLLAVLDVGRPEVVISALAAGLGYFSLLLILNLIYPPGMGFGDVKLALVLGLHTGWVGAVFFDSTTTVLQLTFWALVSGSMIYVAFALLVTIGRRFISRDLLPDPEDDGAEKPIRRIALPLGPSLIAGALFVILFPGTVLP